MTCTQPLTASERYARSILTAWNKREFSELQSTLTQSSRTEGLSSEERERIELIQDLGHGLLRSHAAGRAENAGSQNAALALVRHLARCGTSVR